MERPFRARRLSSKETAAAFRTYQMEGGWQEVGSVCDDFGRKHVTRILS